MAIDISLDLPESLDRPPLRSTEEEFVSWCAKYERMNAEWADGETTVMSPVNLNHNRLNVFLLGVVGGFAAQNALGEVLGPEFTARFRAGGRLVRRLPDVFFVAFERVDRLQPTYFDGAPDLVIEIVSEESVARDWREKYLEYQAAGVREYWVIDPLAKVVEVSTIDSSSGLFRPIATVDGAIASTVLPGFFLRLEWLWSEPRPRVMDILRALGV